MTLMCPLRWFCGLGDRQPAALHVPLVAKLVLHSCGEAGRGGGWGGGGVARVEIGLWSLGREPGLLSEWGWG